MSTATEAVNAEGLNLTTFSIDSSKGKGYRVGQIVKVGEGYLKVVEAYEKNGRFWAKGKAINSYFPVTVNDGDGYGNESTFYAKLDSENGRYLLLRNDGSRVGYVNLTTGRETKTDSRMGSRIILIARAAINGA